MTSPEVSCVGVCMCEIVTLTGCTRPVLLIGLLGAFNPNDDGGDEPDPNEPEPEDDAGHGQRIRFYDLRYI